MAEVDEDVGVPPPMDGGQIQTQTQIQQPPTDAPGIVMATFYLRIVGLIDYNW